LLPTGKTKDPIEEIEKINYGYPCLKLSTLKCNQIWPSFTR